eukprot:CAMPEP_0198274202 /NCGR_PEP_ID=MMETSP1447-20131203/59492_1 /TAXON_ID=420782 /ORGANISM="Chaetoceros dichaeta, Strain CCMP1751" /LENGTH=44 /DNA_ID= /DNA_START= /DNA_END= /DNA_ORIENTATION=
MSLGFARDSLANLLSLVHDEEDDHHSPYTPDSNQPNTDGGLTNS